MTTAFEQEMKGPVDQRLEQGTHNPLVPGSNPGGPSLRVERMKQTLDVNQSFAQNERNEAPWRSVFVIPSVVEESLTILLGKKV